MSDLPPGLVHIPCHGWVYVEPVSALMGLISRVPPGSGVAFERGFPGIAVKRNKGVEKLLAEPRWRWLLMLDSDMVPPPDVVHRPWAAGADLATAACVERLPPHRPCAWRVERDPDGGPESVVAQHRLAGREFLGATRPVDIDMSDPRQADALAKAIGDLSGRRIIVRGG